MYNIDEILAMNRFRLWLYSTKLAQELSQRIAVRAYSDCDDPLVAALHDLDYAIQHSVYLGWVDMFNAIEAAHTALTGEASQ
jgi:hypothetical protein